MAVKLDKTNLVRNLAKKTKFVVHLDKAIQEHGDDDWRFEYTAKKGDDAFHPSGDCTPSLRELYEKASGPIHQDSISASLRKTFMVGHFWHAYLQHITTKVLGMADETSVERRGRRVWGEVDGHPKPFHWASGSGDLAPVNLPVHGDYLVDFKTMGAQDFKLQTLPPRYIEKYECQINVYMDFFDIDRALIVAVNKDSGHDFKEFEYHRNQALIDAINTKWELVSLCLDEGVAPPVGAQVTLPLKGHIL